MNAELLLKHFHQLGDAVDAVPRLRRFILDLAVRGKLVDQVSGEEDAKELLSQIKKRKQVEYEAGNISKPKSLPVVEPEEAPYECPHGWIWTRVREVTSDRGQRIPRQDFTYIDVTAINKEIGRIEGAAVLHPDAAPSRARKVVAKGDVLYSCVRPYLLNIAIVDEQIKPEPIASTAFAILNGFGLVLPKFLWVVLRSSYMIASVEERMRGQAYPAINDAEFSMIPFPLPPLAEQKRIVAKVDELMALCDQLEAAQKEREDRRGRLTAASWQSLTTSGTKPETAFALEQLPQLTARPQQIAALRQTILDLAVRGKLVKQDPKDEPAAELLKRITKDLSQNKKSKRQLAKSTTVPVEGPFDLPNGWTWASFPELGKFGRGKSKHRPRNDAALYTGGSYPLVQTGDVARSKGVVTTYTNLYNEVGLAQSAMWPKGTLCITVAANIADSGILSFDACFPDSVVGFVPAECFANARYFEYFLRTAKAHLLEFAPATAQKNINLEILEAVCIPLPPLAEQKRIVAKVDELMRLCDELEATLQQGVELQGKALEALLQLEEGVGDSDPKPVQNPVTEVRRLGKKRSRHRVA